MKTVELQDEDCWHIDIQENTEKCKYAILEKVYEKLQAIMINSNCSVDFQIFEGIELNAPNLELISIEAKLQISVPYFEGIKLNTPKLKMINLDGIGSVKCFQSIHQNTPNLLMEGFALYRTGITEIPEFILKMKTLHGLTFRREKMAELPDELFSLENLVELSFYYCTEITIIPDDIKKLVNLEHFDLWEANLKYLSPELFLLPKLKSVNLAYTQYPPTKEVLDAFEIFNKRLKKPYDNKPWEKNMR
jgi:Leucine-rich repeat (LRR) protein